MCEHAKVYANYILASIPPKRPWICKKCGEKGADVSGKLEINEYETTINQFSFSTQ